MTRNFSVKALALLLCTAVTLALCACTKTDGNGEDTSGSAESVSKSAKIIEEIEKECTLPEMKEISQEQLFTFYGIDDKDVAYYSAIIAEDSISKDEAAVFEAVDESGADKIYNCLNEHYNKVLDECSEYFPDEYKMVKECSAVKDGTVVRLFISPDANRMIEIYNSYF